MTAAARASFFCMPWEKSVTSFFCSLARLHEVEQLVGARPVVARSRPYMRPTKRRILRAGEAAEERDAFGHDADLALDFDGVGVEIDAENLDTARNWARAVR